MLALRMKVWMLKLHVFPTVKVIPCHLGYPFDFQPTKSANLDLCLERVGVAAAVEEAAEAAEARRLPGPAVLSSGHPRWSQARTRPLAAMIWQILNGGLGKDPGIMGIIWIVSLSQQIGKEIDWLSAKCCLNQELNPLDMFVWLGLKLTSCFTAALVNMKIPSGEMLSLLFRVFLKENVGPKACTKQSLPWIATLLQGMLMRGLHHIAARGEERWY